MTPSAEPALTCPVCPGQPVGDWYSKPCACCGRRIKIFCHDRSRMMVDFKESRDCPHGSAEAYQP